MDIHSQHPYLLGFDSNLIPNSNILVFQPYLGEDSEYSEKSGRFAGIQHLPLGIPQIIGKIFRLVLFFFRGYSRVHCKIEYIEYSPYSDRKTRIIGKFYIFLL